MSLWCEEHKHHPPAAPAAPACKIRCSDQDARFSFAACGYHRGMTNLSISALQLQTALNLTNACRAAGASIADIRLSSSNVDGGFAVGLTIDYYLHDHARQQAFVIAGSGEHIVLDDGHRVGPIDTPDDFRRVSSLADYLRTRVPHDREDANA